MSKLWDNLKMLGLQMFLPVGIAQGEEALHDYLKTLSQKQPKKFAVLIQSLYPTFKGVLQPLCNSTKTPLDNLAVDPTVKMLEDLMTELEIAIPTVVPIDFESDEDLPA